MEYQQASPATNFSKKLANGAGLTGKHAYDGVFGAPANPGARAEDYREIFGGSAACSIPVLDFPELKERNFSIEARGLRPDYSAIFGGGGEADFGVPYEELFPKAKRGKSRGQEERVRTEASSRSVEPKPSNSKEEQRAQSPEASSTTVDDVQQFNLSYNRSNPGTKNGTIGTTHVTQLNVVPGYTHLIDEQVTRQESNSGKAERKTLNDASLNVNANEGIKERKPSSKSVSGPQPQESSEERKLSSKSVSGPQPQESSVERKPSSKSVSGPQPQESSEAPKKTRRHWSFANDVSFDFEIGLGSHPSMSPSNVGNDVGPMKSKSGAFGGDNKKGGNDSYSPPSLDEDLDVNSAAAAVRKAIEEAQAKLRIAKELMERKKQGLPDHVKPIFSNGVKGKKRERKVAEKTNGFSSTKEPNVVKFAVKESNSAQVDFRLQNESRKSIGRFSVPAVVDEKRETAGEVNSEEVRPSDNKKPLDGAKKSEVVEENLKQENFQREMNTVEVTFRWDIFRHNIKSDEELHQVEENEEVAGVANESSEAACGPDMTRLPEENEEVARVVNESSEAVNGPDMTHLPEENEDVARVVNESSEAACGPDMTNLPEEDAESAIQELEIEDAVDQVGDEVRGREAESQEEMKSQSNEGLKEENESGYGTGQKEDLGSTECETKQQESFYQEENDKTSISNPKPEGARKWFRVNREEVIGAIRSSLRDEEDSEKQGENYDTGSDGDQVDSTESDSIFQEDYQMNEIGKQSTYESEEFETIQPEVHQSAEDKNNVEAVENLEATNYVYKLNDNENPGESGEADELEGKVEVAEVTVEDAEVLEHENVVESSDAKENGRESEVVNEANDWVETENVRTDDMEQGPSVSDRSKNLAADMSSGEPESMFDCKQLKYHMTEFEHFEEASFSSCDNERDGSDQGTDVSGQGSESNTVSSGDDKWFSHGIDSMMPFTSEKQVDETVYGLGETNQDGEQPQIPPNHEEFETYFKSSLEKEEEEKVNESQEGKIHQNIKDKNHQETETVENRNSEDNLKKKLQNREKMEEMRMKEMERMAVERAIREVRERAFAEARERAEQAAAKKAAAGARERLEKVSSETNAKSAADKASMEAKLKAQRAAVERATAEARERALRKALSEKSSSKMAKQAEKSTTEKSSGASRGSETKLNDQQSKATYERNQRTAERAAKALAEKNMRDLQAQKEQAERNRLAEILDAEVKRWATGKERNLRALLSTLQYILGSDSGWQPIPLTDLIASAAVKKAYRKATLFVHPDKLQQRGASIQQKYTCEKVFDLLKDAWNKFSAEER